MGDNISLSPFFQRCRCLPQPPPRPVPPRPAPPRPVSPRLTPSHLCPNPQGYWVVAPSRHGAHNWEAVGELSALEVRRWPAWKCPRLPCGGSHPGTPTPFGKSLGALLATWKWGVVWRIPHIQAQQPYLHGPPGAPLALLETHAPDIHAPQSPHDAIDFPIVCYVPRRPWRRWLPPWRGPPGSPKSAPSPNRPPTPPPRPPPPPGPPRRPPGGT